MNNLSNRVRVSILFFSFFACALSLIIIHLKFWIRLINSSEPFGCVWQKLLTARFNVSISSTFQIFLILFSILCRVCIVSCIREFVFEITSLVIDFSSLVLSKLQYAAQRRKRSCGPICASCFFRTGCKTRFSTHFVLSYVFSKSLMVFASHRNRFQSDVVELSPFKSRQR